MESAEYSFAPDSGYGEEDVTLEYPTLLLRLIAKPSGPEWLKEYLATLDSAALSSDDPHDRTELMRDDPLLFALCYLIHHLRSDETHNKLSFAEFHLDVLEDAKEWATHPTAPREFRDCYVAPRGVGKSTWLFTILPIWAAAYKHVNFIVAFSDSSDQSKNHLATMRNEFDMNNLLIQDFPDLCEPKIRQKGGAMSKKLVSSRVDRIEQANGFVMIAKGSGAAARGMKVGTRRPDLIILDDIEPGEEKYSPAVMIQRLRWMLETVFHLNEFARLIIVGTVTAPGSIMHQLVESVLHPSDETPGWIKDQQIDVHYYAPILLNDDGTERSGWPAKWPLAYLKEHEHTASFKKEFLNQPISIDGNFWTVDDIRYLDVEVPYAVLHLDPATTSNSGSHPTGLAIVGFNPITAQAIVLFATQVKLSPQKLRESVLWYCEQYPEIGLVQIESNQGGETWRSVFHDMPVRVDLTWSSLPKQLRLTRLLNLYQRDRVRHKAPIMRLEQYMTAYTGTDAQAYGNDIIDAVEGAVRKFIHAPKRPVGGTYSYMRHTVAADVD